MVTSSVLLLFCLSVGVAVLVVEMFLRPLISRLFSSKVSIAGTAGTKAKIGFTECKMVLCVRTDLSMGKGKIAAQCGHAVIGAYRQAVKKEASILQMWSRHGEGKIVLKIPDEQEMFQLCQKAKQAGLNHYLVCDAGRTQIPSGSVTVLAIGPGPIKQVDEITGHLKLL
eukprot:GHVS01045229.1.p1 GENE.GHVS01045229.1~~GHVS01045229.1.p1  ORF type:complete len:169 (-),score=20.37 GHVS01045229.1:508-1014(-)